jgi:hypothetical protein
MYLSSSPLIMVQATPSSSPIRLTSATKASVFISLVGVSTILWKKSTNQHARSQVRAVTKYQADIETEATQTSTQIISELVVPGGLVEYPPFPGNLEICSSNHGGGNLPTTYYYYASFTILIILCLMQCYGFGPVYGRSRKFMP